MLKSTTNLSSRSTLFSSKQSSSSRRKKKYMIKSIEKPSLTETEILAKKTIKDIIEHAIQIADFHIRHKKYQKAYENRKIKREQNFVTQDEQFSGYLPQTKEKYDWCFISKIMEKIVYLESNGDLKIFDFKTDMYLLFNLSEKNTDNIIVAAELYEYEQNMQSNLFILYKDFSFNSIDIYLLNKEGSRTNPEDMPNLLNNSKKIFFNCKPYLNIPNIDEYLPNYDNNLKVIIFPKMINDYCTDIILNFTQVAGKFLIYNTTSNSVIGNFILSQQDYVTTESEYLSNLRKLLCAFFEKIWSVKQYDLLCEIIDNICNPNSNDKKINILDELKKLAILLNMASNDEDDNLSLMLKTQLYTFTEIKGLKSAKQRNLETEKFYTSVILPIYAKSSEGHCMISFESLLYKLKIFFEKLYGCSIAVGKSDLSLISGRFKLFQKLFLKCYNRGINLKQLFLNKDPNNYGYVDEKIAFEILQNLPIGLNASEIEELLLSYNILDENGKYMYDYLFKLDEQIITSIVFSSPINLLGNSKFTCGYFIKNSTTNNIVINPGQLNNMKGKMSAPTEKDTELISLNSQFDINKVYGNNIEEKGNLFMPENTLDFDSLIDYIINSCLTIEVNDIIFITSLNIFFIVTPYNQNIPIFRYNTKWTNKTQKLELIGNINLNSYYILSPMFLYCIEERNLLITQRYTINTTEIVFIDISKDLLFPSRGKKAIEYTISDEDNKCKRIKNLLTFEKGRENVVMFKNLEFLKKNELFAIISDESIYIINPKSHTNDISLKMQEIKKTAYTKLCRQFCENPIEQTGHQKFKLLYKIDITSPLKKFLLFSLGNDLIDDEHLHQYSNTDWLFLLFDTGEISSYCVNQIYLSQKAKEIDTPLPEKDVEQFFVFAINNMKNSLAKYQNYLERSSSYINMLNRKNEETLDQITLNIKENMLYEKVLKLNAKGHQIHTIYQLIYLLKLFNLKFETNQLFEMFPHFHFSSVEYNSDSSYFKTELFPIDKNYEEIGINIEEIHLPKNKNQLKSDLSSLETNLSLIDSAIKKLGKYIVENNYKNDQIFKNIDINEEEILDYEQFSEGCEKYGLISKKYMNQQELKTLFQNMDDNNSNVLTLDEFNKYLEKIDIFSVISTIKNENEKRKKEEEFLYDIEKFVNSSEEEKKQALSPILEKVQKFYSNIPDIKYNDIKDYMDQIKKRISQSEIKSQFINGFIFLDDFKNLIYKTIPTIEEVDINKIFAYFDQNNKNLFIYVRDFIKYLNNNNELDNSIGIQTSTEYLNKMTGEHFLLILIGIIKKLLKLCIMELGLNPDSFSEKFILSKKYEKHIIILNYIQTEIAKDNIKRKITNFLPLEEKILFYYYIDYYNYGILFEDDLKSLFDNMMKYINDSDIYDLTKFDTFDPENANKYINRQKYNINKNEKNLEDNYLMNLLPVFDKTLLEFAYHIQKKDNTKNLKTLYNYLRTIGEEKDFLSQKEFMKFLKEYIPPGLFNSRFAKNLINQLSENVTLINEPIRPVISVSRIILYIINIIKKFEILKPIINIQELVFGNKKILLDNFNKCVCRLSQFDSLISEVEVLSEKYLQMIKDCSFSGLIIVNKNEIIENIKNKLNQTNLDIMNYNNYYMNLGNNKLIINFNKLLKKGMIKKSKINCFIYDRALPENFLSLIDIPMIKIDVLDTKEMINLKKFQSGMIENFDYFQPELQCVVNVTKIRKSFLKQQISKDNDNLYNHIIQSLKLNHYLQQKHFEKTKTKSFESFLFLRNFGVYTKDILINKEIEEEFYIVNEKLDLNEFISFHSLVKENGGLFYIPEIVNTDIGYYIIRAWEKNIITIINELNQINRCFKYFNIRDFYGTFNGRKIKMSNIYSYCCYNEKGETTFGPDIFKILLLLDKLPTGMVDQLPSETLENIYENDAFIAPEIITKIGGNNPNYKIDSWLFGVLFFNLLFGKSPKSFYSQFKEWSDTFYEENIAKQLLSDDSFDILSSNFFYNPFSTIKDISQDKNYFAHVLKKESFSAIIKNGLEKNNKYSIWTFIDLINACLNIDPEKRPSIQSLLNFDLFDVDLQAYLTEHKDVSNIINYYSPDNVIKNKMVIPLRGIICEILRNQDINSFDINNYQNYIYNVIFELNKYIFSESFETVEENNKDDDSISSTNQSYEDNKEQFKKENSEYQHKKTVLVKYVIDHKLVDLLIFLVLRHFNNNLKIFKQKIQNERNDYEEEKNSELYSYDNNNKTSKNMNINQKETFNNQYKNSKNYYSELEKNCGKLISALVKFLYNCVQSLNTYEHVLSLYVEDVLIWIIKLFIGEENQLLGKLCDDRNSNDKIKKYLLYRTFMRDENIITQKDFQEDELDQVYSVTNSNKQLIEIKSYWSPELHYFVNDLFREAFGENCSGSFKHSVIKNYFLISNSFQRKENQINPLSKNTKDMNYILPSGENKDIRINNDFINTDYVGELLSLIDIMKKLSDKTKNMRQMNEIKKNALNYINIIFKSKNCSKIRGCLDCKIHFLIEQFLFTSINELKIKKELFNILKEISLSLVDVNEISWIFGNNYEKIFGMKSKKKNINNDLMDLENNPYVNESSWDSNISLIDFMSDILNQPHSFVLNFTNKILNTHNDSTTYATNMKEFGFIFSSPLILKPVMHSLQKRNENYNIRQICLEILFNILLSNEIKITSNLNMTMCNFYEILIDIVSNNYMKSSSKMMSSSGLRNEDDFEIGEKEKYFLESVNKVIKIIIEMQNPDIKKQIFNCPQLLKYMERNRLSFAPRLELDEIVEQFTTIQNLLNFENLEGKIIFLIDAFKRCIYETNEKILNENIAKIRTIVSIIHHIFNNEWSNGLKSAKKNCLVFNIVKLFEWLVKSNHKEYLFPKNSESFTSSIIISFMSKTKENTENMKKLMIDINKMIVMSKSEKSKSEYKINVFGSNVYSLNKIYNFISIQLLNIIYTIFSLGDSYYNTILNKMKIGILLSELFICQLETLSIFLTQENVDISILNNYMTEVKIRLGLIETIMMLPKAFDDIKMQFLQSEFINYIFKYMIDDNRKFKTNSKKLSLDFLAYKSTYPMRNEAIVFLDIIFKKYYNKKKKTETDSFVFDEIIRNVKVFHLVQNQLAIIKTKIKGDEVLSVLGFFNMALSNNEREIIKIMNSENAKDYFIYSLQKETSLKKMFPHIVEYIDKVQAGIEK